MEAIYVDVDKPIGLARFAPVCVARGAMFGAGQRAAQAHATSPVITEQELYGANE
jgi:hypothetical protein